jgi:hypothetical protein
MEYTYQFYLWGSVSPYVGVSETVLRPDVVLHIHNLRAHEAEAGGSWVWRQPGLHSQTLYQKKFLIKLKKKGRALILGININLFT